MTFVYRIAVLVAISLVIAACLNIEAAFATKQKITSGTVTNSAGEPVIGASVAVFHAGNRFGGAVSDLQGAFAVPISLEIPDTLVILASSLGFDTARIVLPPGGTDNVVDIVMVEKPIDAGSVTVIGSRNETESREVLDNETIITASQHSLVATNPTAAIQQSGVSRAGSGHSSKLRMSGTSPAYYLDGLEIGRDPNHYGTFAIVPASVVDKMRVYLHGSPARYGLPAAVELETPQGFEKHFMPSVAVSLIDATGTLSVGNDRYFVLGTLRKSVLDKLVRQLDVSSHRRTIPPTNFQDVFVTGGILPAKNVRFLIDQYDSRDYLSYRSSATSNNPQGIVTVQHAHESFGGFRLEAAFGRSLIKVRGAVASSIEQYYVTTGTTALKDGLYVDLKASRQTALADVEFKQLRGATEFAVGQQLRYTWRRDLNLTQHNWNFLPPDFASDNPHLFQTELNTAYKKIALQQGGVDGAGYVSARHRRGKIEIETGIRVEYFGELSRSWNLLSRNNVTADLGRYGRLAFSFGTYAETPVNRILEPYQVLIQANLSELEPIRTALAALEYSHGPFSIGAFHKRIINLPVILPDSPSDESDLLRLASAEQAEFIGVDAGVELKDMLSSRIDLSAYYACSRAQKEIGPVAVPYELDAPHTLWSRIILRAGRRVTLHSETMLRTGYPYTPYPGDGGLIADDKSSAGSYEAALGEENSRRFPAYFSVNLGASLSFRHGEVFVSLSNITNHENPIINTRDGFVYDTGILPSIGFRRSF